MFGADSGGGVFVLRPAEGKAGLLRWEAHDEAVTAWSEGPDGTLLSPGGDRSRGWDLTGRNLQDMKVPGETALGHMRVGEVLATWNERGVLHLHRLGPGASPPMHDRWGFPLRFHYGVPMSNAPRCGGVHLLVLAHLSALTGCGGGASAPVADPAVPVQPVAEPKASGVVDDADALVKLGLAKDRDDALAQLASQRAASTPPAVPSAAVPSAAVPSADRESAAPSARAAPAKRARADKAFPSVVPGRVDGAECTEHSQCESEYCSELGDLRTCAAKATPVILGRPLLVENRAHVAECVGGADHAHPLVVAAFEEHASIAAFARTLCQLMALGAPLSLVRATEQALADEIAHAAQTLAAARALGLTPPDFGQLPRALAPLGAMKDLPEALLRDVLRGGCIGETVAAGRALDEARARPAGDVLHAFHARIAVDEARHAALAFATARWLVETHPALGHVVDEVLAGLVGEADPEVLAEVLPAWQATFGCSAA